MIVAVFISDREDLYLPGCIESFNAQPEACAVKALHVVDDREHQLGMAGAVQAAWEWVLNFDADYLFHCEEDFRFNDIPFIGMRSVLELCPHLAEVVLKRQPWSAEEKAVGGQIETNPAAYTECSYGTLHWVEHQTLFSLNPCLIPRRTLELGWTPGALGAERAITDACVNAGMRFAYYGRIADEPRCEHVGHERSAGYRW